MNKTLANILVGSLIVGLSLLSTVLNGFTVATLWGWFIVPIFGVPAISIVAGLGLFLFVKLLVMDRTTTNKKDEEDKSLDYYVDKAFKGMFINASINLFALGYGWILTLFI